MFIHCKQLVDTEGLQQGSTVSYDTEYVRNRTVMQLVNVASPQSREWTMDVPVRQAHDATVDAIMPSPRTRELEAEA